MASPAKRKHLRLLSFEAGLRRAFAEAVRAGARAVDEATLSRLMYSSMPVFVHKAHGDDLVEPSRSSVL